jgi:hypothetical protein
MSTHYVASAKENQLLLEPVLTDLNEQGSLDFVPSVPTYLRHSRWP